MSQKEEPKLLQVGDVLYGIAKSRRVDREVIVRVTTTLAISDRGTRFRRDVRKAYTQDSDLYANGSVEESGPWQSGGNSWYLATVGLESLHERYKVYESVYYRRDKMPLTKMNVEELTEYKDLLDRMIAKYPDK